MQLGHDHFETKVKVSVLSRTVISYVLEEFTLKLRPVEQSLVCLESRQEAEYIQENSQ